MNALVESDEDLLRTAGLVQASSSPFLWSRRISENTVRIRRHASSCCCTACPQRQFFCCCKFAEKKEKLSQQKLSSSALSDCSSAAAAARRQLTPLQYGDLLPSPIVRPLHCINRLTSSKCRIYSASCGCVGVWVWVSLSQRGVFRRGRTLAQLWAETSSTLTRARPWICIERSLVNFSYRCNSNSVLPFFLLSSLPDSHKLTKCH